MTSRIALALAAIALVAATGCDPFDPCARNAFFTAIDTVCGITEGLECGSVQDCAAGTHCLPCGLCVDDDDCGSRAGQCTTDDDCTDAPNGARSCDAACGCVIGE